MRSCEGREVALALTLGGELRGRGQQQLCLGWTRVDPRIGCAVVPFVGAILYLPTRPYSPPSAAAAADRVRVDAEERARQTGGGGGGSSRATGRNLRDMSLKTRYRARFSFLF